MVLVAVRMPGRSAERSFFLRKPSVSQNVFPDFGPTLLGKIEEGLKFKWSGAFPPSNLSIGFLFRVTMEGSPSARSLMDVLIGVKVKLGTAEFEVQVNQVARVDVLNKEITVRLNASGQGGVRQVDANPMEDVDVERTYQVIIVPPKKITVFLRQEKFEVEEDEAWTHVSQRFAMSKGLHEWSQYRIFPVNGQVQRFDEELDNAYTFDWEAGKQYWWWNVYDEAADLVRGEG
jgi:hypothetical protein